MNRSARTGDLNGTTNSCQYITLIPAQSVMGAVATMFSYLEWRGYYKKMSWNLETQETQTSWGQTQQQIGRAVMFSLRHNDNIIFHNGIDWHKREFLWQSTFAKSLCAYFKNNPYTSSTATAVEGAGWTTGVPCLTGTQPTQNACVITWPILRFCWERKHRIPRY